MRRSGREVDAEVLAPHELAAMRDVRQAEGDLVRACRRDRAGSVRDVRREEAAMKCFLCGVAKTATQLFDCTGQRICARCMLIPTVERCVIDKLKRVLLAQIAEQGDGS